ncbi:DUF3027 domain-containing protein [Nocardia fluminea]|uniref:DUF3027 domain-containing protein n=1 Tax=Nocardia fluminea TaxID=134984 RepID=UPI003716F6EF
MSAVSVSESGVRPVLADAAEVARRALVALEPDGVGVHLGVSAEDDTAATHRFEATLPGYRGWQWAVVVAAPPGADHATVSESALLPALDALIAPDFVPWEQRVRPGDLGPGDLLATPADDPRLVPGYVATGDPVIDEVAREVGLGRVQVLSLEGRADAAQRWYTEYGPDTEMAKAAPGTCGMCGFYLPLAGALRESFGVCGNAMGADGHVVHIEYGCGAHSDVVAPSGNGSPLYEAFDDHAVDFVEIVRPAVEDAINKAESAAAAEDTASTAGSQALAEDSASEVATEATSEDVASKVATQGAEDSVSAVAPQHSAEDSAKKGAHQPVAEDSATAVEPQAVAEGSATEAVAQVAAEDSATTVDDVVADADSATAVVEVVAEASADPAIEVVEVAAGTIATVPAGSDTEEATDQSPADALTEVGAAAAERAGDQQETAEAEAVAAADAERSALAEGTLPETPDEVIAAELASDTDVPTATVPAAQAELGAGDESAAAETGVVSAAEAEPDTEANAAGAEATSATEATSGVEAAAETAEAGADSAEGAASVSGGAESGGAAESADLSEHGSSVSR